MFEIEVNHGSLETADIPGEIVQQFAGTGVAAGALSILPWEEHCTECAMPMCYETCDLYESRKDGKCRRFFDGIVTVPGIDNVQGYVVRVSFKRWGQLLAYANNHMISPRRVHNLERFFFYGAGIVSRIPDQAISVLGRRSVSARMMRRLKQSVVRSGLFGSRGLQPDYFMAEIFNPGSDEVHLSLTISSRDEETYRAGFQSLLELKQGYNCFRIPVAEIARQVDLEGRFSVSLNPNILRQEDEGLTLFFGVLAFMCDPLRANETASAPADSRPHIKVVAWDLDNTLWEGTLIEDGLSGLVLNPDRADIVRQFDERGILNTVVSKNNHDDAMAALKQFGLEQYFLHPSIGWGRKGVYLKDIPLKFNVGADTIAFIDDSPFERDEALSLNSELRVYDAADCDGLLAMPEFNPPLTTESGRRREYYREQTVRDTSLDSFDGDYLSFLRDCRIVLKIYSPGSENIGRIQELVQRTNQLNFSGNRYRREQIESLLDDPRYYAWCIDCEDRYGQYGTVGFAVINVRENKLVDMMLSCRVQAKRVEHAFVSFLLRRSKAEGRDLFIAHYNKTERNRKAGAVFEDLGFVPSDTGVEGDYTFDLQQAIPDDGVIEVLLEGEACPY
jgi:FkbH-like protein